MGRSWPQILFAVFAMQNANLVHVHRMDTKYSYYGNGQSDQLYASVRIRPSKKWLNRNLAPERYGELFSNDDFFRFTTIDGRKATT